MQSHAIACLAGALLLGVAGAALGQPRDPADPGANVPSRQAPSFEPPSGPRRVPEHVDPSLRFTIRDRDHFEAWAVKEYGKGKCPPGLLKREGRCLTRGHPRKRYTVGLPLPVGVVPAPVPLDLARRVGTPAIGFRYGMIDGDLVKLEVGSGLTVDALDGLIPK
ncbi:MAG: hypothetical protein OZ928_07660 [Polyangiaceae bacterium]|nr:hypothetical protein [Polyangiaceae bacterium]